MLGVRGGTSTDSQYRWDCSHTEIGACPKG
eukprot:SAG31_NODE_8437_length_1452_cov_2.221729_3_plen_30_part_00